MSSLSQGSARPDLDQRDRDWKCLGLNNETETEMSKSQWQDRDWKDVSLNDETETVNVWVSNTRPRLKIWVSMTRPRLRLKRSLQRDWAKDVDTDTETPTDFCSPHWWGGEWSTGHEMNSVRYGSSDNCQIGWHWVFLTYRANSDISRWNLVLKKQTWSNKWIEFDLDFLSLVRFLLFGCFFG